MSPQLPKWSDLDHIGSMENKLSLYEAYTANNGNIFESNEPTNLEAFDRLARSGDTLAVNSNGLVITLALMNNELSVIQGPELVKLIEKRPDSYLLELLEQENRVVEFPIKSKSVSVPMITLLFKTIESYNKLNTFVTMVFGKVLPKYENKNITENIMSGILAGIANDDIEQLDENLRKWFKEKWVRFGPDGKIRGPCARGDDSEGKPKCLPQKKAHSIGKKGRKYAAAKKRREDPNPERRGKAKNVATKKKSNEDIQVNEKWSQKYKDSINCSNPKGFSQKAHCASKRKYESMNEEQKCPECGGPMYHESMMNEKKDACYHKVRSRYKVWPSAYASGALVQCRKKGASNWGTSGKKNESSIMKGIVDEGENVLVLYIDGKPSTKYARNHEATADAERLRAKFPNKKIEIKQEVREDENEPETFKKGQQVWLKTRPLPNSPHTGKVYKVGEKFVILNCSGHLYKARKDNVTGDSKKSYLSTKYPHIKEEQLDELSPETMLKYRKKADDDANYADATGDDARFDKRVKGVMSANRLLRNKKTNETAYEAELDDNEPRIVIGVYGAKSKQFRKKFANQKAQDRFFDHPDREGNYEIHYVQKATVSEGVIVGHDANDPEVAILGGAGTMSLSRLKKKAQGEAEQLANDLTRGRFKAAAYNIKQLENTLKTIVAAEDEMEKGYFGEGILDRFKKKPPRDKQAEMRSRIAAMSDDELRYEILSYNQRLPQAVAQGSLVAGAVKDYINALAIERDKRAYEKLKSDHPDSGLEEGIFDRLKKKSKKPELDLPRWPNSNNANEWMAAKADYYAKHDPKNLHMLFSPAAGDYLPLSVHVGSSWKPENLKFYRELKKKYPEAVEQAKEMTTGIAGRVSLSRVGDPEDFHGMSITNENAWNQLGQRKPNTNLPAPERGSRVNHGRRFEEGDIVLPLSGPLKGQPHKVIHSQRTVIRIVPLGRNTYPGDTIAPRTKHEWVVPADMNEDYTGEFAAEKTNETNPYGGLKDRQFRGAIGETPTDNPTGASGEGGWRKYKPKSAGTLKEGTNELKAFLEKYPEAKDAMHNAVRHFEYAYDAMDHVAGHVLHKMPYSEWQKVRQDFIDYFAAHGLNDEVNEEQLDEKCWDTHKQVGMKKKGDKMVPNCVPKESAIMKGLKR